MFYSAEMKTFQSMSMKAIREITGCGWPGRAKILSGVILKYIFDINYNVILTRFPAIFFVSRIYFYFFRARNVYSFASVMVRVITIVLDVQLHLSLIRT